MPLDHDVPDSRNYVVLKAFNEYCAAHPEQRFWQAITEAVEFSQEDL